MQYLYRNTLISKNISKILLVAWSLCLLLLKPLGRPRPRSITDLKQMEWTSVKKGWVYQRKKHLFLPTTWSPKYLVLYTAPIPALAIYEQRSDAMPPYAPLLHLELTAGDILVSTVGIVGKSGGSGGLFGYLADSMSSRKASIVSALSRRGSFRDLTDRSSHDSSTDASISSQNTKTKSYKERMLDEQGFMITRQSSSGSVTLKVHTRGISMR